MRIHEMNLLKKPFEEIRSGKKTVEMRLFDEKRQGIAEGDVIIFRSEAFPGESIEAKTESLYIYEDFLSLAESFAPRELGFEGNDARYIADFMGKIYGKSEIRKYGTVAIKIKILKN